MNSGLHENGFLADKEKSKVSLKDNLWMYLRYLPFFILSVIIALFLSFLYLRYTTPVYSVDASLLIKEETNRGTPGEKFSELMFFRDNTNLSNEIEILRSLALMQRVVATLNLQTSYFAIGNIKQANIYKEYPFTLKPEIQKDTASAFQLDIKIINENQFTLNNKKAALNFNQIFETPNGFFRLIKHEPAFANRTSQEYSIKWSPMEDAANAIIKNIKIRPVNTSADVLYLSLIIDNKRLGEDIINTLMKEYKSATIEDKNQIAQSTYNFIDNRLLLISSELGDVEKSLETYKRSNQIFNLEGESESIVDRIQAIEKEINANEVKIQVAKMIEDYVSDTSNVYSLVPSSLGIEDPTLMALVSGFNQLIVEREKKVKETGPQNFFIIELEDKIRRARISIRENLRNVIKSYGVMGQGLQAQKSSIRSEVSRVPEKEKQLRDISRQQGIKESLYLYLLQKREETAITLASTISNSRVVDLARSSKSPVSPDRKNIYLIALLIGLLVPFVAIYLINLLNDKVESKDDISKVSNIPVIGFVGHSRTKDLLVVTKASRKVLAEQFRIIRTNLQFFLKQSKSSVILVTSSFSGEGKSFVSTNLGSVMALAGKRTAIMELDIRKPKIASGLNLKKNAGITNYLVGNAQLEEIIVPVDGHENLFVIPCGPVPPNPSELLLDVKLQRLFDELKKQFDVIVVDSAPVGLVSDALELGKYSTCTVYIVRQRYTLKKQLRMIDEMYSEKRLPQMSALVNDVKIKSSSYYGYKGYGYGYGYGEAEGYYEKEEPQTAGNIFKNISKKILGPKRS